MAPSEPPSLRVVLAAMSAGVVMFLGMALALGPVPTGWPAATVALVATAAALLLPLVGLMLGARLRPDDTLAPPPDPEARAARAQAVRRALIVQAACAEAGAFVGGLGLLVAGRQPWLLAALAVPLLGLALAWTRAGETSA